MRPYCSFCKAENGPLIAAPIEEGAFICERCAESCIVLFIELHQKEKAQEKAANE